MSGAGHLAYARGGVYPERRRSALRVTSTGNTITLDMDSRDYTHLRVSPDGNRLAFAAGPGVHDEIWIHDLVRGVSQRLNTGGFSDRHPVWSPDSQWLAFDSNRDGALAKLYRVRVDGSGEPERLAPSDRYQHMSSWSSQGVIAYLEMAGDTDIWVLPPDGVNGTLFHVGGE